MPMSPRFQHNKTVEEYRQLAEKCREIARTISAASERAKLLARAQAWDLIADRSRKTENGPTAVENKTRLGPPFFLFLRLGPVLRPIPPNGGRGWQSESLAPSNRKAGSGGGTGQAKCVQKIRGS